MTTRFRLRELLAEKGLSQSALSRQSGVSFATINALVANRTVRVDLATLDSIAEALGVRPGDLLEREPPRKRPSK